jgi:hypothetical protein
MTSSIKAPGNCSAGARNGQNAAVWALVALTVAFASIVILPLTMVQIPALIDYPNYLARMHVLGSSADSPLINKYYEIKWRIIPYLSMDLTYEFMKNWIDLYVFGKIYIILSAMAPPASLFILHYALYRRLSLIPLVGFIFSYNGLFLWGFLNYLPTVCAAIIVFALWIYSRDWKIGIRFAIFLILSFMLYVGHLVAFGVFGLLAGAWEAGRVCRRLLAGEGWRQSIALAGLPLLLAVTLPGLLFAAGLHIDNAFVGESVTKWGDIGSKRYALLSPLIMFGGRFDLLTAIVLLLWVVSGVATGVLRFSRDLTFCAALVGIVAVIAPNVMNNVYGMDFRLPLVEAILVIAMLREGRNYTLARALAGLAVIAILLGLRATVMEREMTRMDQEVQTYRNVLREMPRGQRLLMVDATNKERVPRPGWPKLTIHAAMVAVIDRDAFVPTLFTGMSTVGVRPEYLTSSTPNGVPVPNLDDLRADFGRSDQSDRGPYGREGGRIYWRGWERKFDYVLVEHFNRKYDALPGKLKLAASSDVVDLYEIQK